MRFSDSLLQIWVALRDPKDHVREAAAEAVGACLQLVAERENGSLSSCYGKTFEEAQAVPTAWICAHHAYAPCL